MEENQPIPRQAFFFGRGHDREDTHVDPLVVMFVYKKKKNTHFLLSNPTMELPLPCESMLFKKKTYPCYNKRTYIESMYEDLSRLKTRAPLR